MARIAAVGDIHLDGVHPGLFRRSLQPLRYQADILLLAGDLTERGTLAEARFVVSELDGVGVPIVAVLGNHEYFSGAAPAIAEVLTEAGVLMLEESTTVVECAGVRIGVAGMTGHLGGFPAEPGPDDDERARAFAALLSSLDADVRVALTHYAPIAGTLAGEPDRLYPLLGSSATGAALDRAQPHLALHGHAHYGVEHGTTAGGVPVRNVAFPVLRQPYRVYRVDTDEPHGQQVQTVLRTSRWRRRPRRP